MDLLSADRVALLLDDTKMTDLTFDFESNIEPEIQEHGATLGARRDKAVVCKHWLRGLCKKGDMCEFLHEYDLSRMPVCFFFTKYGECSNADCIYRHIAVEEVVKDCPWYDRGFCKHGGSCRHKHTRKIACENYLVGFCPEGPSCKFGHPKFELPKEDASAPVITREALGIRPPPPEQIRNRVVCHRCGQPGHKINQCPTPASMPGAFPTGPPHAGGSGAGGGVGGVGAAGGVVDYPPGDKGPPRPLETVTCFKCGQVGHYANKCTNRRAQPPPGGYVLPNGKIAVPPGITFGGLTPGAIPASGGPPIAGRPLPTLPDTEMYNVQ